LKRKHLDQEGKLICLLTIVISNNYLATNICSEDGSTAFSIKTLSRMALSITKLLGSLDEINAIFTVCFISEDTNVKHPNTTTIYNEY